MTRSAMTPAGARLALVRLYQIFPEAGAPSVL